MDQQTKLFVEGAKQMLKRASTGSADPQWVNTLTAWSQQKCVCGAELEVTSFERTGSGARRTFKCGHSHNVISLQESIRVEEGFSAAKVGLSKSGELDIQVRIGGVDQSKENKELSTVKLLSHFFKPNLTSFQNDIQDSPIDIIASDNNGEIENFQVTRLHDQQFWKDLKTNGQVDKILPEIESLVESAIKRKHKYGKLGNDLILVIDAWPGMPQELADKTRSLPIVINSGFKEVWLSGPVKEMTFKIYPNL